ncbi:MAG: hypothetical protein OXU20_05150 [Myxococcales bacterium]|nr:hypothetical protein [Myxococcales bacterium]MDD9969073.1 hypothetical protein [Myxococcales bacterium]
MAAPEGTPAAAAEMEEANDASRPVVLISSDRVRSVREAVAALQQRTDVFQRGGILVHATRDAATAKWLVTPRGAPRIAQIPTSVLLLKIADSATCKSYKRTEDGVKLLRCHPPHWLGKTIADLGEWSAFPYLQAVTETPLLKPDGTILSNPGYDADTGILFVPPCTYPRVPDRPTLEDVERARRLLEAPFADFPFAGNSHLGCAIAGILTIMARFAFRGPTPLFLVDASTAGSGKGLLVFVVCMIATGREPGVAVASDGEELRKTITAHAIAGSRTILLDNIIGEIGGSALCAALTTTTWTDRVLGANVNYSGPLLPVWFTTGNNVTLGPDMHRRVCHVRLEPSSERPEERTGFAVPDLRRWVEQHHAQLLTAALTILRGYCAVGRPDMGLTPWGSYEGWSALVRSAVVWAGWSDPGDARDELRAAACTGDLAAKRLAYGWYLLGESTAADAVETLYPRAPGGCPAVQRPLRDAIDELTRGKEVTAARLGKLLSKHRGRNLGGLKLDFVTVRGIGVWSSTGTPDGTFSEGGGA